MTNQANTAEATELSLYAVNTANLYRQRALPILKNLAAKRVAGTYEATKALKAWQYLADDAAKAYRAEFRMTGGFDKATRELAATQIANHYAEALDYWANLERIWRMTHRDYRGTVNGERCILVLRDGGTTLVPLSALTAEEIAKR